MKLNIELCDLEVPLLIDMHTKQCSRDCVVLTCLAVVSCVVCVVLTCLAVVSYVVCVGALASPAARHVRGRNTPPSVLTQGASAPTRARVALRPHALHNNIN